MTDHVGHCLQVELIQLMRELLPVPSRLVRALFVVVLLLLIMVAAVAAMLLLVAVVSIILVVILVLLPWLVSLLVLLSGSACVCFALPSGLLLGLVWYEAWLLCCLLES